MKFHLETERLLLREFRITDVDDMFELDSNPKVHQYLGKKTIKTKEEAKKMIDFILKQYKENGIGRFAVIEKSSGSFIGWSGLKLNKGTKESLNDFQDFIDIGYRFIPKYWKKGYGLETAIACLEYGFKTMNLDIIYGAAEIENIGSNKILQKIGLEFVNEFKEGNELVNWYELKKENYGK
ncbi:GNAT family N-acetyltransferase [Polaribacter sp. AHE13PA]|uniref:GNAT family N-acetyltransferase n=1 Tax=Polaribacter sp. AHE13PA TaxID=2745562 RepID=UPI001C4E373B|nr:GNAT family N-acetyltransferase [Polaribacter sp. AHE13PA]QXP66210.1 GNAT family N-acetyltransferase [Polaribacter sp. AHE13PA]